MEQNSPLFALVNAEHQFSFENGITLTHVEPGLTRGVLRAGPNSINPEGHIHGGAIATLADTVAGCCACSMISIIASALSSSEGSGLTARE